MEYIPVIEALEAQNQRIIQLMAQVQAVDTGIKTSKEYIRRELITGGDKSTGGVVYKEDQESSGGDIRR
jgi:hypothetical protein